MLPIFDILTPVISKILDFIPDPQKKAEAQEKMREEIDRHQEEILKAFTTGDVAQAEVNKQEAASPNLFIAGWRPAAGWVCVAGFAWAFVLQPVLACILAATHHTITLPTLAAGELTGMLSGMLGLTAARSFEKYNDVAANH